MHPKGLGLTTNRVCRLVGNCLFLYRLFFVYKNIYLYFFLEKKVPKIQGSSKVRRALQFSNQTGRADAKLPLTHKTFLMAILLYASLLLASLPVC
jgi:hypothetical protein